MTKVIGIDLGTTNSCVAVIERDGPVVLENREGGRTTPSVVAVAPKTGERYAGQVAKRQAVTNPGNTIFSVKRLMGRKFDDPEVEHARRILPYKIVKAENGDAYVEMAGTVYSPPQISSIILQKIKQDAEERLGEKITEAVITVPAYFNDAQRQATKDAGEIAGLTVLRIINEPTAAALAYGFGKDAEERTVAVFDLGGGTFDISILQLADGIYEVISTNGDTFLGGDDVDNCIVEWLREEFKKQTGVDVGKDKTALQRLRDGAEKAKVELSSTLETEINLPFLTADATGPQHMNITLTRSRLEQLVSSLIERMTDPCKKAMADANMKPEDIDEVILVGGATRMPLVRRRVSEIFGREPQQGVNPDEAVGVGAAIQGGVLSGKIKDVLLLDVTPLTLGIETLGGVATSLIERNTTIPTSKAELFSTATDNQQSVEIHVVQGERPMVEDNKSIGRFIFDGILPAPRGVPQIEVMFDIDANGILNVSARDKGTGREQRITIQPISGLSDQDIERMTREASQFAEEDAKKRADIEARNQADALVYTTEKLLREHANSLPEELIGGVTEKAAALKHALEQSDASAITNGMLELNAALENLGKEVYGQETDSSEAPPQEEDPGEEVTAEDDENAIEGEFKEIS